VPEDIFTVVDENELAEIEDDTPTYMQGMSITPQNSSSTTQSSSPFPIIPAPFYVTKRTPRGGWGMGDTLPPLEQVTIFHGSGTVRRERTAILYAVFNTKDNVISQVTGDYGWINVRWSESNASNLTFEDETHSKVSTWDPLAGNQVQIFASRRVTASGRADATVTATLVLDDMGRRSLPGNGANTRIQVVAARKHNDTITLSSAAILQTGPSSTRHFRKLNSNTEVTIVGEYNQPGNPRNQWWYVQTPWAGEERYMFVRKSAEYRPNAVDDPPNSMIKRGTVTQYLDMGIGYFIDTPINNANYISSRFGPRWGTYHIGFDITTGVTGAIKNRNLISVTSGEVVYVNTDRSRSQGYCIAIKSTNPNHICPVTEQPLIFIYMHMQDEPTLEREDLVTKGQVIGRVGNSPQSEFNSDGSLGSDYHLHFEVSNHGTTWGPGSTGATRVVNRINPIFFYPKGTFRGVDTVWSETW